MGFDWFARRRDRFQEGPDRQHVIPCHLREPLVGEGRIEILALAPDTLVHRAIEVVVRPGANPMNGVGRNIRRVEGAEGRVDRCASGIGRASRLCVTGFAISRPGEVGASFHKGGIGRARCIGRSGNCGRRATIKIAAITEAQALIFCIATPNSALVTQSNVLTVSEA